MGKSVQKGNNMKKAIIFGGGGDMGVAASYAMSKLGYDVQIVDPNPESRKKAMNVFCLGHRSRIRSRMYRRGSVQVSSEPDFENANVAISAAPYIFNEEIAINCFEKQIPYCDLGGNPTVSKKIQQLAVQNNGHAFTDLGLAPGLVNIMAEAAFESADSVSSLQMMVGGLPNKTDNKLRYSLVFNMEGLYNELTGDCEVIEDGKVVVKKALSVELEKFNLRTEWKPEVSIGDDGRYHQLPTEGYEATITKGGMSHSLELMKNRGVKNCSYKTIRYEGHFDIIKFLLEDCQMNLEEFSKFITRACPATKDDFVVIGVRINGKLHSHRIESDETWTAMQKGTAFPTAAAACLMDENIKNLPNVVNYSHIPIKKYSDTIKQIGGIGDPFLKWNDK
jgi:saccharopine dehydrogenase-like NADP-dependent oxidoreductase